ncbi:gpi anchored serine-rich protein, partial [Fusarium heterosporum]
MRYSFAAAALLASGAIAHDEVSKVYETKRVTITSCGPEVTNCPARSTVISTTSYPVPPPKVTGAYPVPPQEGQETSESVPEVPATTEGAAPVTTEVPLTTSTIYSTNIKTITSCGPEVTNCP